MRKLSIYGSLLAISAISVGNAVCQPAQADEFDSHFGQVYVERDSGPLKADLYVPKGKGPFPGVLVVHGGAWFTGTRAQLSGFAQLLASRGLTAVAISYRFAPQHKFPAQIEDCKEAVRWMRENAERLKIDPQRIGGFGYSAGAHLAALLGTTDAEDGLEGNAQPQSPSTRLLAVAGGGAPCDFRTMPLDLKMLAFWLGGTRREQEGQYRLASPAAFVTADDPPMFFFHGENDTLVPVDSPIAMCQQLNDAGVSAELYVVPNAGHVFAVMDRTALDKCATFLADKLRADGGMP
ncbi:MAG: alpha/beta hydrolase [Planctomycetes bacterium]|nr:alpha/beta hydrolase [Planctomycetota bacterium]